MTYDDTITTTLDPVVPGKVVISWKKPILKKSGRAVGAPRFAYKLIVNFEDRYEVVGLDYVRDVTPLDAWVASATSYTYSRVLTNNDLNDLTGYPINVELYIYSLEMFGVVNTASQTVLNRIDYSVLPTFSAKKLMAPSVPSVSLEQIEPIAYPKILTTNPSSYLSKYPLVTSQKVSDANLDWLFFEDLSANHTSSISTKQLAIYTEQQSTNYLTRIVDNQNVSGRDYEIFKLNISTPLNAYLDGAILDSDPFAPQDATFFDAVTKSYDIRYRKNVGSGASAQWSTLDATSAIVVSSIPTRTTILFAISKIAGGSKPGGYGDYEISVAARIKQSQIVAKSGTSAPTLATTAFGQYTSVKFRVERPVEKVYFMSEYGTLASGESGVNMGTYYVERAYAKYIYDYNEDEYFTSNVYGATPVIRDVTKNGDMTSAATRSHMIANGPYTALFIQPPLGDIFNAVSVAKIPTAKVVVDGILAAATAFLSRYPNATVYITEIPMFGVNGRTSGSRLPLATSFANLPQSLSNGVIKSAVANRQSVLARIISTLDQVNALLRQTFNATANGVSSLGIPAQSYVYTRYTSKYSTDYRDRVILLGGPVFEIERTANGSPDGTPSQSSRVPATPISIITPQPRIRRSK
jgi:hypothetical protein